MESVTKHECTNNVERESKAQKHRYQKFWSWDRDSFERHGVALVLCDPAPALLWDVRQRGATSGSWLSRLPHDI